MSDNNEALLRAILMTTGRQAFSVERLTDIVLSKGASAKQVQAYNMCDGTKVQADIVRALKLDAGNFSRTVARWMMEGVVFKLGEGRDARLVHIYPLPDSVGKKRK